MPPDLLDLPNIDAGAFAAPDAAALRPVAMKHRPRILLLYGSLRERSVSRFATMEAARLLGLTEVPTLRFSHLGEAEKRAYILADNRLAEKAGWEPHLVGSGRPE